MGLLKKMKKSYFGVGLIKKLNKDCVFGLLWEILMNCIVIWIKKEELINFWKNKKIE